jgi:hypothetical protein
MVFDLNSSVSLCAGISVGIFITFFSPSQVQLLQAMSKSAARTLSPRGETSGQQTTLESAPTPDVLYVLLGACSSRIHLIAIFESTIADCCHVFLLVQGSV